MQRRLWLHAPRNAASLGLELSNYKISPWHNPSRKKYCISIYQSVLTGDEWFLFHRTQQPQPSPGSTPFPQPHLQQHSPLTHSALARFAHSLNTLCNKTGTAYKNIKYFIVGSCMFLAPLLCIQTSSSSASAKHTIRKSINNASRDNTSCHRKRISTSQWAVHPSSVPEDHKSSCKM